jgi:hypothetical protein
MPEAWFPQPQLTDRKALFAMRKTLPALAAGACGTGALLLGVAIPASAATVHHAGSCQGRGDYAACVASGNMTRPSHIVVNLHGFPSQAVSVSWDMVCSEGSGAGDKHGSFTDHDGIGHWPIPHPYAHPSSCSVAAEGQLEGSHGTKINVWLTYTR